MIMVQAYDFGCGEAALASPGESQGLRRFWRTPFTEPLYCVGFGSPSWRPLQWRCKTGGTHHSTGDTPSVRFVGSEMPPNPTAFNSGMIATGNHNFERFAALCNTPKVEPRVLRTRERREAKSLPYNSCTKPWGHTTKSPPAVENRRKSTEFSRSCG